MDIVSLIKNRLSETYTLHRRYVNPQFVRVLEVIGYNRNYTRASGSRIIDEQGREVLDFLSLKTGWPYKFPGSAWTTVKDLGLRTVRTA